MISSRFLGRAAAAPPRNQCLASIEAGKLRTLPAHARVAYVAWERPSSLRCTVARLDCLRFIAGFLFIPRLPAFPYAIAEAMRLNSSHVGQNNGTDNVFQILVFQDAEACTDWFRSGPAQNEISWACQTL